MNFEKSLIPVILVLLGIWLFVLSVYVAKIVTSLQKLTKGLDNGNLINVLNKILKKEKTNRDDIASLNKGLDRLVSEVEGHTQKVGLVKFNPFKELGGEHSFSLALLNGKNTGIIITSLHTRERTRVYIKEVKNGKIAYDLSTEEKQALKIAVKGN